MLERLYLNHPSNISVYFETKEFVVKVAETRRELLQALRLRYEVFHREYAGKKFAIGFDVDRFDSHGDLLIIVEKLSKAVVGTYRLMLSSKIHDYYSSEEFFIWPLLQLPGIKLELSRACVRQDFRTGAVLALLWKGISQYIKSTGASTIFGCSSVRITQPYRILGLVEHLRSKGFVHESIFIRPKAEFEVSYDDTSNTALGIMPQLEKWESHIPALLKSYLRMGARICSLPALDRKFRCIDLLTLLNLDEMNARYGRRFEMRAEQNPLSL